MQNKQHILIISDLDGSLLNHHDYAYSDAAEALNIIWENKIPLILNSSKTIAEMLSIRNQLHNEHPFIVENGACLMLPEHSFAAQCKELISENGYLQKSFSTPIQDFLPRLKQLRNQFNVRFRGFSEMHCEEVMQLTGLDESAAQKAKQRLYSEPILWQDSAAAWEAFSYQLNKQHLSYLQGGRFISISSGVNKGLAVTWLKQLYLNLHGQEPIIIALGDSENDIAMLELADYPVLIKSPVKETPVPTSLTRLIRTQQAGSAGWNTAVLSILNKLSIGAPTDG